jgi:hypothetical protein
MVLHPVGGRRQSAAGIQNVLVVYQQLAERRRRAADTRKNPPAAIPPGHRGSRWESPQGPRIDQLAGGGIHHQVVVSEKIYPQDGELHVRQQEDPREGDAMEG